MKRCEYCGSRTPPDSSFQCRSCGAPRVKLDAYLPVPKSDYFFVWNPLARYRRNHPELIGVTE